jgi:hypothetical protein
VVASVLLVGDVEWLAVACADVAAAFVMGQRELGTTPLGKLSLPKFKHFTFITDTNYK